MRLLSEQDVLLLVSDIEGQSVAMLEAMGNGVVPVVTDLPGQREVVADRKSGFLIPSAEMDGFVAVISKLAADRDLLSRMSQAAWNRIRNTYSMDAAVLQFAALLEDVSQRPLPNKDKVRQVSYPISRMGQLGVPHFVQGLKRWCFRQSVLW
jgi:glycosyltransferase involved in cell wall biosynthesis